MVNICLSANDRFFLLDHKCSCCCYWSGILLLRVVLLLLTPKKKVRNLRFFPHSSYAFLPAFWSTPLTNSHSLPASFPKTQPNAWNRNANRHTTPPLWFSSLYLYRCASIPRVCTTCGPGRWAQPEEGKIARKGRIRQRGAPQVTALSKCHGIGVPQR